MGRKPKKRQLKHGTDRINGGIVMTYEEILKTYHDVCKNRQLSDNYLQENKCETRKELPIAAEFPYGIIYLQDDAVDVLINRIEELEVKCRKGEQE